VRLPLDHIPFYATIDLMLLDSFRELGFFCSPKGYYTSPEYANVVWETNCVFPVTRWFDLIVDRQLTTSKSATPGGCLFLTENLNQTLASLPAATVAACYSLDRCWEEVETAGEHFELASLRGSPTVGYLFRSSSICWRTCSRIF
jgi:hypothetical protein